MVTMKKRGGEEKKGEQEEEDEAIPKRTQMTSSLCEKLGKNCQALIYWKPSMCLA